MHKAILRRVGVVLIAVGLLDIGWMIYSISHGMSYGSSFNIFAVIGGAFLLRGSLRAASIVRTFASFYLGCFVCLVFAAPLLEPIDLIWTRMRLSPGFWLGSIAITLVALMLIFWIFLELGRQPVRAEIVATGRKLPPIRFAMFVGGAIPICLGFAATFSSRSESAVRAIDEARQRLGSNYSYHVGSLSIATDSTGEHVSGKVTAWTNNAVLEIPFAWDENH